MKTGLAQHGLRRTQYGGWSPQARRTPSAVRRALRGRRSARGFSLLEVLVAFAILALSLGVLLQIFQRAMNTTMVSTEYSRIVALAEARLADVGGSIPLEEGIHTGEPENGMDWIVSIQPYQPPGWLGEDPAPPMQPFLVTAVASLPTINGARQVTLRSVQLAAPLLPGL
ncbi:prepilin-type N-terminal cleavage/methylation domain-containing protein [uncultured Thiohalocapsa sp.]|uniref:type IV pilus modification PilV family protein n=1 Tax=uncultured Thiohalocapsa sp. TaxID=768990 RepID=UPI0025F47BCD|nr:prepilin-type N-terminal cleavage/methylation domain-containing protein [uncultured Thiohalocapsa sp.]